MIICDPDRLHGLLHVRRRPDRRAVCQKSSDYTDLRARDAGKDASSSSPERVISVRIGKIGRDTTPILSVDGGRAFRLNTRRRDHHKDSLRRVTKLVRLKQTSFFEILNKKFIDRQR